MPLLTLGMRFQILLDLIQYFSQKMPFGLLFKYQSNGCIAFLYSGPRSGLIFWILGSDIQTSPSCLITQFLIIHSIPSPFRTMHLLKLPAQQHPKITIGIVDRVEHPLVNYLQSLFQGSCKMKPRHSLPDS